MARSSIYPPSVTPRIPRLGSRPNGWVETTYGDVLEKVTRKAEIKDDQRYQLVTAKRSRGGIVPRSQLYGKEIKTEAQFYICANDFLISKRQIIHGACGIVPETLDGSIVSGEYSALRVKSVLLLDYLKYHCHTVYFQQTCFQSSVGVDVEKMIFDLEEWLKFRVYLPPLPEQRKIAAILSTWDEAIDLTAQLIAAKQRRKQALMQRLLTGKVRFPGFEEEWEEATLGDVTSKVGSGITPKGGSESYLASGIPLIRSQNVLTGMLDLEDVAFISEEQHKKMSATQLKAKDVLLNITGASIGRSCVVPVNFVEGNVNQHVCIIRPTPQLNSTFLSAFLNSDIGQRQIDAFQAGGNRQGLNYNQIRSFKIPLPTIAEQEKIAKVFRVCDDELDLLHQKLAALRRQKQGLMQQLLTGKVRVTG